MRSLKKLLAVLMALALMASVMVVPAFAEEASSEFTYQAEANKLFEMGLLKGTGGTADSMNLGGYLNREEGAAMLLRLFGLEGEAEMMTDDMVNQNLKKFSDASQIADWAKKTVANAVKNGLINGRPDGKFAPKQSLFGKEFAKMVLAQLGQYNPANFQTACADLAAISTLPADEAVRLNDSVLKRDDLAGLAYHTLSAKYAGGMTVISVLADNPVIRIKAIEFGLITISKITSEVAPIEIKVGETLELPELLEVEYADGSKESVKAIWDVKDVNTAEAGEYTAIGKVEAFDGTVEVAVTVKEDKVMVDSVSADNLKEVKVVYNQDVSANSAVANKDNYSLDAKAISSVSVSGNTAVLTLADGVANQKAANLTVKAAILGADETKAFAFFDATLPEADEAITITGPKSFTIGFSEPIKETGSLSMKVGSSTLSLNVNGMTGKGTNKITVPMYTAFVDGKEYTLNVTGFEDYAGYDNINKTYTFTYTKDATLPVATIDSTSQERVVVSFNKPVKGITADHFSHTFSAWKAIKVTASDSYAANAVTANDSLTKVYVWFYGANNATDKPIAEGDTSFRILGKNAAGTEIVDEWGNKFETADYTISVAADKSAPEVKAVAVESETSATVEFTKNVTFTKDNVEVLNSDGSAISGINLSVETVTANTKFRVKFGTNLAGKSIIVNVKNAEDTTLNTNKMADYSTTLDVTDKTAPTIDSVKLDAANKALYVFFKEDVDTTTALTAGNYYLVDAGVYTKLSESAAFFGGSKIVKIGLTDTQVATAAKDATQMFVSGVKDLAANEILPTLVADIAALSNSVPKMDKVVATATNVIEITFSEELSVIDPAAFNIGADDATAKIAAFDTAMDGSKTKAILTLKDDANLPVDVHGVNITYNTVTVKDAQNNDVVTVPYIKNKFNIMPAAGESVAITDAIKPALISADPIVKNVDGDKIEIRFTEALKAETAAFYMNDLVITKDGNALRAGVDYQTALKVGDAKVIVVTVAAGTYTVKSVDAPKYIEDASGNGNMATAFTTGVSVTTVALPAPAPEE